MTPPQIHPSSPLPQASDYTDTTTYDSAAEGDQQYGPEQYQRQGDVSPVVAFTSLPLALSTADSSGTTATATGTNPYIDSSNNTRKRKLIDTGHTTADDLPTRLSPCSFSGSVSCPSSPPTTAASTTTITDDEDSNIENRHEGFDDSRNISAAPPHHSVSSFPSPNICRGVSDRDADRSSHAPSATLPLFPPSTTVATFDHLTPPSPPPNHPHHVHGMTTAPTPDNDASASSPSPSAQPSVEPTPFLGPSNSMSNKPPSRCQSPAKRLKSEDPTNATVDCSLDDCAPTPPEPMDEDTAVSVETTRDVSVDMVDADDMPTTLEAAEPTLITEDPSTAASSVAVTATRPSSASTSTATSIATSSLPSVEEQIGIVIRDKMAPLEEGETYYLISGAWLRRFLAQSPEYADLQIDKAEMEKELGPIDNNPIIEDEILEERKKSDDTFSSSTDDLFTENFTPVKRGLKCGEDYEILSAAVWEQLVSWYGLAKDSPVLTRKAINTQENRFAQPNVIVEVSPPVFTVYRLRNPKTNVSGDSLREEKQVKPRKVLAATAQGFRDFLKQIKNLTGVETSRMVRLWKVTVDEPAEKATKKSAKSAPSPFRQMTMDLRPFLALENGTGRELVNVPDSTSNPNYNGSVKIGTLGLGAGGKIVVEEQNSDGEWISESSVKTLTKSGELVTVAKNGPSKNTVIPKKKPDAPPSRSASPAKSALSKPLMFANRGRERARPRGTCGLSNLGNTCYMNSALQCLRSVEELSKYFLSGEYENELNPSNPLAHHGKVARAYGGLVNCIFAPSSPPSVAPREFKSIVGRFGPSFSGYQQQDSQEFLAFLLDGMHEDLNRIMKKPYTEKPDSTDEMVGNPRLIAELAERHWDIYKKRNDSAVADLFGGLYKSTLVCPECQKVSITFDPFMDLTLPLPIESFFTKTFFFWPKNLQGQTPLKFNVEMPKNSSIGALKEHVAKKFDVNPKKIMCSEVYNSKFFKHYHDYNVITEISSTDEVVFYELDEVPTSWPGPKTRSMLYPDEQPDPASTEQILVPVLLWRPARRSDMRGDLFGIPCLIVLSQDETYDYNAILEKVVERIQFLTAPDMYATHAAEEEESDYDGAEEAAKIGFEGEKNGDKESAETNVEEDEKKDGLVDVAMKDTASTSNFMRSEPGPHPEGKMEITDDSPVVPSRRRVPDHIQEYFTLKIGMRTGGERLPSGLNGPHIVEPLISRMQPCRNRAPSPMSHEPSPLFDIPSAEDSGGRSPASQASDEDKLLYSQEPPPLEPLNMMTDASDDETPAPFSPAQIVAPELLGTTSGTSSTNGYASSSRFRTPEPVQDYGPLIRVGESIIVEFNAKGFAAIRDEYCRKELWSSLPVVDDPELEKRRKKRDERKTKGIFLEDCLDEFSREEILSAEDPWYCPRCKEHRRASKKFELWKCPDILVIHLKRFSSSRSFRDKIDAQIGCPIEGLDLSQRVGFTEGKPMIYDLIAVDNHYGGLGGGHYTAYVKNWYDGKWYYCDDASVREVHGYTVVTPAAYLLFYRRRSNKPLGGPKFEQIAAQRFPSVAEEGEEDDEMNVQQGSSPGISRENSPPLLSTILQKASHGSKFLSTNVGNAALWGNSLPVARPEPIAAEDDGALPKYDDLDNAGGVQLATDEGLGDDAETDIASNLFLDFPDSREGEEDEEKVEDVML